MRDLMVDIETLGSNLDPVIIQIGACYFDRLTGEIGRKFCGNILIQEGIDLGFKVEGKTIEFWLNQANRSFLKDPRPLGEVLVDFKRFCYDSVDRAWAHATFDFPILANAYKVLKIEMPFPYKAMRDIRTLIDLSGVDRPVSTTDPKTHDALDDCIYQVGYCTLCFQELERRKQRW